VAAVVMAKVVMAAIIMAISVCPHLLPRFRLIVLDNNDQVHTFFKTWNGCLVVNKVFLCLYDMKEVVCSALLVLTT
jgi:hypothetical protein